MSLFTDTVKRLTGGTTQTQDPTVQQSQPLSDLFGQSGLLLPAVALFATQQRQQSTVLGAVTLSAAAMSWIVHLATNESNNNGSTTTTTTTDNSTGDGRTPFTVNLDMLRRIGQVLNQDSSRVPPTVRSEILTFVDSYVRRALGPSTSGTNQPT